MHTLDEIKQRIAHLHFSEPFDLVVAVAQGGIIPAALINQRLQVDFQLIKIHLRDTHQMPVFDRPRLMETIGFDFAHKCILLVEDRVKTGASLQLAKTLLESQAKMVKTFAVNGKADYSLYDEPCFKFPWIL